MGSACIFFKSDLVMLSWIQSFDEQKTIAIKNYVRFYVTFYCEKVAIFDKSR